MRPWPRPTRAPASVLCALSLSRTTTSPGRSSGPRHCSTYASKARAVIAPCSIIGATIPSRVSAAVTVTLSPQFFGTRPARVRPAAFARGPGHRQVDASFVDEKQPRGSSDGASTQELLALLLNLRSVGFRRVESLFLRVSPSSMRRREMVEMLTRTFKRAANSSTNSSRVASPCRDQEAQLNLAPRRELSLLARR